MSPVREKLQAMIAKVLLILSLLPVSILSQSSVSHVWVADNGTADIDWLRFEK